MATASGLLMMHMYKADGMALRRLRARRNLTLKALDEKAGVSYTQISRIENGDSPHPRFGTVQRLADALGATTDDLLIYEEEASPSAPRPLRSDNGNLGGGREVNKMASQYRKSTGSDTWHYCSNCSNYPRSGYTTSNGKPTYGELCNECQGKERNGECR